MSKILIKFIQDKQKWEAMGKIGQSLMSLANQDGEIFGYCGGQLACTTCRVYIAKKYQPLLPKPTEIEEDVLCELPNNINYPEKDYVKRMSCQLKCTSQLNGLTVVIPPPIL
ncbi:unnamed protein product [Blepharisma stoltei]|uniref:Ferredoxin n=1 Tax=Blepharisma stoltei TaxID=1481888 RepID=A0AAU9IFU5_9CILI|nr:unnamed protein product [Blepharisma stoltei]